MRLGAGRPDSAAAMVCDVGLGRGKTWPGDLRRRNRGRRPARVREDSVTTDNGRPGREASLGELVAIATRDVSLLVRQEIELAKAELTRQAISGAIGGGLLAVAAGLGLGALIAVTIGLGELFTWAGIERFWSYFLVTLLYLVLAGLLGLFGGRRLSKLRPPERTIASVKEDVELLRHPSGPAAKAYANGQVDGSSHSRVVERATGG